MSRFGKVGTALFLTLSLLAWQGSSAKASVASSVSGVVTQTCCLSLSVQGCWPFCAAPTCCAPPTTTAFYPPPPPVTCFMPPPVVAIPVPLPLPVGCCCPPPVCGCAPSCSCCTSCGACPSCGILGCPSCATGNCPGGNCNLPQTQPPPRPLPEQKSASPATGSVPNSNVPKTFAEEPKSKAIPPQKKQTKSPFDEGFQPRKPQPNVPQKSKEPIETKAFKVPTTTPKSVIEHKKPAPVPDSNSGWQSVKPAPADKAARAGTTTGSASSNNSTSSNKSAAEPNKSTSPTRKQTPSTSRKPGTQKKADQQTKDSGPQTLPAAPGLRLDQKITWRVVPKTTQRLKTRTYWLHQQVRTGSWVVARSAARSVQK